MKQALLVLLGVFALSCVSHAELARQAENNGLSMSVSLESELRTGSESTVNVTLQNKSGKRLLVPVIEGVSPSCTMNFSSPHTDPMYYSRPPLRMENLVRLIPQESKVLRYPLRPKISSPCRLVVVFANSQSTVRITETIRRKTGEKSSVGYRVVKDVEEPDLWRGQITIDMPLTVTRSADQMKRARLAAFRRLRLLQQAGFLESLCPMQNEADCEMIAEAVRMLPQDDPLRFSCWASLAPPLAKGIGVELIPFAVDELENARNPKPLRMLLVQLLAELGRKPTLECDEDHNLIRSELPDLMKARIKHALETASADPDLAEAAKAGPPEEDK